jgi:hypothetical protein
MITRFDAELAVAMLWIWGPLVTDTGNTDA